MLKIENLNVYLEGSSIVKNCSLEIKKGEIFSLLGVSGCGKSTLIKAVLGLIPSSSESVFLNGRDITALPPEKRDCTVVFQDLRLFPHLTVGENIAFPLHFQKKNKTEERKIVEELLSLVSLEGFSRRTIESLSGGQKQRVAIARALAQNAELLLLDEPFSSLDPNLRKEMGELLLHLREKRGLSVLLVTHDHEEALRLSDRIALMKEGEILQCGRGEELFYAPKTVYAAKFMGEANFILGRVERGEFKMPFFPILNDNHSCTAQSLVVADKPDGEYYLFLRERQLKFQKASGALQKSEALQKSDAEEMHFPEEAIDSREKVQAYSSASLFYPISSQCIGDSWRVFWENENGLVLHNLSDRPQDLEHVPYRMVLQAEKGVILFSKEELLED